jgi:hypothetical protein
VARQIIVDVSPEGVVKIDAQGFSGKQCLKATAPLEKLLSPVSQRDEKPEMLLTTEVEQQVDLHA